MTPNKRAKQPSLSTKPQVPRITVIKRGIKRRGVCMRYIVPQRVMRRMSVGGVSGHGMRSSWRRYRWMSILSRGVILNLLARKVMISRIRSFCWLIMTCWYGQRMKLFISILWSVWMCFKNLI